MGSPRVRPRVAVVKVIVFWIGLGFERESEFKGPFMSSASEGVFASVEVLRIPEHGAASTSSASAIVILPNLCLRSPVERNRYSSYRFVLVAAQDHVTLHGVASRVITLVWVQLNRETHLKERKEV